MTMSGWMRTARGTQRAGLLATLKGLEALPREVGPLRVEGALFDLVLRLRSTYLALFTIGFSEILRAVLSAEIDVTQGQAGETAGRILDARRRGQGGAEAAAVEEAADSGDGGAELHPRPARTNMTSAPPSGGRGGRGMHHSTEQRRGTRPMLDPLRNLTAGG